MPFAFPLPLLECRGDSIAEGLDGKRTVSGAVTSAACLVSGQAPAVSTTGEAMAALEPTVAVTELSIADIQARFAQGF